MNDPDEDQEMRDAYESDKGEAHALEMWAQQRQQIRHDVSNDPKREDFWWECIIFQAIPLREAEGLVVWPSPDDDQGGRVMSRADAIELRNFLTQAIEGTLEQTEPMGSRLAPLEVESADDDTVPF